MKYCPTCQITYADETLRFCLQDGTGLLDSSVSAQMPTQVFGEKETVVRQTPPPTQDFNEKETVVRQTPVTSGWQPNRVTQGAAAAQPEVKKSNTFPAVILTALIMCILFGAVMIGWFWLGGNRSENKNLSVVTNKNKTTSPTKTPANPNDGNRNFRDDPGYDTDNEWDWDQNASLDGERLTYYRGTTPEQCQADCAGNPKCVAFTLIRAGAYNPQDPPMCYLMSKVTKSTYATCCITGIRKGFKP